MFDFVYLDIEYSSNCSFDYLAIYDGENDDAQLLQKYCTPIQHGNFINH